MPNGADAAGTIRRWLQTEIGEGDRFRPASRSTKAARGIERLWRRSTLATGIPERGEYREGPAAVVPDTPGRPQQITGKLLDLQPRPADCLFDFCHLGACRGIIRFVPIEGRRAGFSCHVQKRPPGRPAPDD